MISDACVYSYPLGSSSLRRMALEAKHLGFSRLVCANADFKAATPKEFEGRTTFEIYGVGIVRGAVIKAENFKDFQNQVKKYDSVPIVAVNAGDNAFNRSVLTSGRINILRNIDGAPKNAFACVSLPLFATNERSSSQPAWWKRFLFSSIHSATSSMFLPCAR